MSWTLIEEQTLAANATSIVLGSGETIPQNYLDLALIVSARTDRGSLNNDMILIRPNGSSTNLKALRMWGTGAGATTQTNATTATVAVVATSLQTANTFSNSMAYIYNYTSANNKVFLVDGIAENTASAANQEFSTSLWSLGNAITSITLVPETGPNILTGSSFYLYGIF